jgi:hypothetical protein
MPIGVVHCLGGDLGGTVLGCRARPFGLGVSPDETNVAQVFPDSGW